MRLPQMLAAAAAAVLSAAPTVVATPHPHPHPQPEAAAMPGLLSVADPVLDLLAMPPPEMLRTTRRSPECAAINGGELQCCRGTMAGDVQLVVWLAKLYGYKLNPNDINGVNCDGEIATCPGVKVCCQVTALSPLLSLWCQDS
ncbi:hypothetical protein GGTG_05496 [Gaeumannomyces tritici R3-111a-1]|uniref:Hydrophobin n=1 Tax=Gaeumannomyces tritici (strain R3-111a-1) TaxID=644352 RepID=J3NW33_GAET3|nr:hypothetical protein GGTG_05496 [Gaeumannomyces tritici R3-111a-1]EJT75563.1 hypothetical protein GGTG_05496 [Gaeumannomyces tritici R3-111a-1]